MPATPLASMTPSMQKNFGDYEAEIKSMITKGDIHAGCGRNTVLLRKNLLGAPGLQIRAHKCTSSTDEVAAPICQTT